MFENICKKCRRGGKCFRQNTWLQDCKDYIPDYNITISNRTYQKITCPKCGHEFQEDKE